MFIIMDAKYAICLDVGGTSIKSAIVDSTGNLYDETYKLANVNTNGSKDYIINVFTLIIKEHTDYLKSKGLELVGVGIGMCGPLDYDKGICLIPPHLHKFNSLYGVNLKSALINSTGIKNILFENDAATFLRGEVWVGAAKSFCRVIGITIGTGLGSAFFSHGHIVITGQGVPPDGWIGGLPYKDGIVEDYIARRWILSKYAELDKNKKTIDVVDIANLAYEGDKTCIAIFNEMGTRLGEVIAPFADEFQAECIVFGGQISKSFDLFEYGLKKSLANITSLKKITKALYPDKSALYGAAKLIFSKELK